MIFKFLITSVPVPLKDCCGIVLLSSGPCQTTHLICFWSQHFYERKVNSNCFPSLLGGLPTSWRSSKNAILGSFFMITVMVKHQNYGVSIIFHKCRVILVTVIWDQTVLHHLVYEMLDVGKCDLILQEKCRWKPPVKTVQLISYRSEPSLLSLLVWQTHVN